MRDVGFGYPENGGGPATPGGVQSSPSLFLDTPKYMSLWLTILGMGLVTYAIRLVPLLALERWPLPLRLRQALRFVPPAVLSAILLPELVRPGGIVDVSFANDRLIAGLSAIAIAWFSKNVLLTIAAGLVVLWTLQAWP